MLEFLRDVNRISIYFCKPFMSVMMLRFLFKKIRKVLYFTSERSAFVSLQLIDRTLFQNKQKIKRGYPKDIFLYKPQIKKKKQQCRLGDHLCFFVFYHKMLAKWLKCLFSTFYQNRDFCEALKIRSTVYWRNLHFINFPLKKKKKKSISVNSFQLRFYNLGY